MRRYISIRVVHAMLWILAVLALLSCFWALIQGPETLQVLKFTVLRIKVALSLRFDALSTILFLMISLLAAAIARFAIRHLDGEERQWYYYQYLLLTVFAVSLFVLSSNLLMLFAAWLLTSYGLHRLLIYYNDQPEALNAAKKKAVVSRIGDLALIAGIILIFDTFHTLEFERIFAMYESWPSYRQDSLRMEIIILLFVVGAMIKSAQFPFHFWLPDTMATPSPVSALMHAGIINAGGFLMIRISPLLQEVQWGPALLIVAGALTSVYGALSMITQSNIKKKLGYSTISQMGMMLFACGLGAYSIALFHIFAHSFYKAHAFLSTGSLVEESRKTGFKLRPISWPGMLLAMAGGAGLIYGALEFDSGAHFALFIYGTVLWFGLIQNSGSGSVEYSFLRVWSGILTLMLVALGMYALLEFSLGLYLKDLVPENRTQSWNSPYFIASMVAAFLFFLGLLLTRSLQRGDRITRRLYVFLLNGGYFSALSDRWMEKNTPLMSRGGA